MSIAVRRACRPLARVRRLLPAPLLLSTALAALAAALGGCGTQPSQLVVSLTSIASNCTDTSNVTTAKPGDTLFYKVSVVNKGPGSATNVHLALELPANFHYTATPRVDHDIVGAPRLTVTDPQPRATAPGWGTWNLAAPTTNADGTARYSNVDVCFTAEAGGDPGDYKLQPHAGGDQDADVTGPTAAIHLDAAPQLQVDVSADRTTVSRGKDVLYRVRVNNFGTGAATGVGVLVTLPAGLTYLRTETVSGNASRDHPVDPVVGTLEAFFGGFTIPAKSDLGPGAVDLVIRAHCGFCTNGTYTVTVQVSDDKGTLKAVSNAAAVDVTGSAVVSAAPTPAPTAAATAAPAPAPAASPSP